MSAKSRASARANFEMSPSDVRDIRHRLGLSQRALADRMGASHAAVSLWESGSRPCRGPAVILLRLWRDQIDAAVSA